MLMIYVNCLCAFRCCRYSQLMSLTKLHLNLNGQKPRLKEPKMRSGGAFFCQNKSFKFDYSEPIVTTHLSFFVLWDFSRVLMSATGAAVEIVEIKSANRKTTR